MSPLSDCVFPEEIMLCILTRLPVKSILRFRSVCKPWSNLFSTRQFMKMHQGQYSSDPNNQSVIIDHCNAKNMMSLFKIESNETKPMILDHPHLEIKIQSMGCCNGLICLTPLDDIPSNFFLWNPAMKVYKYVKIFGFSDIETESLGFGYDAERDDYKVVRIVWFLEKKEVDVGMWVEVYSVSTDSWITIKPDFKFKVFSTVNTVIANGNPYWIAEVEEEEDMFMSVLVCFDVRRMVFKVVPLHSIVCNIEHATLMDWKGSLGSLVCTTTDCDNMTKPLHVLVFDDDDQIWRKVRTFGPIEVDVGEVMGCSVNVKMLCCKDDKLFVFDPETGWVKFYESELPLVEIQACLYTERLTCIKGMVSEPEK
ncbi:hypothetical protein CASFOL_011113 [Castilleja foliolosa]|uniref:F-box domain-containing protein n=1 Tax=Castilleja foliolosa TaxID=1961234 RepID=A0ABD3DUZ5_9LAMI